MLKKYYRNTDGTVTAVNADGSEDHCLHAGAQEITEEEALAKPPITAEELKEIITRYRWEVETGGITLPGGIKVATALDDQNRITTVVANARLAGLEQVKFKAASGWATLSLSEVESIAAAIALHVQACFAAECTHHDAIDAIAKIEDPAARQAALDAYNEADGWPA